MIVVPAFAVAENPEEQVVSRIIRRFEILGTKDMADRVNGPGHVVRQADSR